MAAKTTRKPTAVQRTISMFTGKMDIEDPDRARDGFLPGDTRRGEQGFRLLSWDGGVSKWYVMDGPRGESYVIVKDAKGYHATFYYQKLGTFQDILAAGDACQRHYDPRALPKREAKS